MTVFPYQYYIILLVGDLEHFSPIVGMMIQSDFHIFRGGCIPPTRLQYQLSKYRNIEPVGISPYFYDNRILLLYYYLLIRIAPSTIYPANPS